VTSSVGILGAGRMGLPLSARLVHRGYPVTVCDPAVSADTIGSIGASVEVDAAALAASVEILITVLPGRRESAEVMPALLGSMTQGSLWLDLTSGDPELSIALAAAAPHVAAVAAPMGGGPAAAAAGELTFYVGGYDERAARILGTLGAVEQAGPNPADGQTVKLLANLLWFGQAVAVTEAMLLGQAAGVAPSVLRRTLAASAGGSAFIDRHLDALLAGDYLEDFGLDRVVEELDTLVGIADRTGTPFELSGLVTRLHRAALERFGPVEGELLVAKLLEQRADRELRL
jgi:3-hydroxyisobutyrate dehydrogenase-like beta-hydroxyacid dehydrogenase